MEADPFGSTNARVTAALAKISLALRRERWRQAGDQGLTPTQAQLLATLAAHDGRLRPGALAQSLAVSAPTVSDAVSALTRKGLVGREPVLGDRRGANVALTAAGQTVAGRVGDKPALLLDTVDELGEAEQAVLLRALVKVIRGRQQRGRIPVTRMSCRATSSGRESTRTGGGRITARSSTPRTTCGATSWQAHQHEKGDPYVHHHPRLCPRR